MEAREVLATLSNMMTYVCDGPICLDTALCINIPGFFWFYVILALEIRGH